MLTLVFVANVGQADLSLPGATGTLSCVAEETLNLCSQTEAAV